MSKTLGELGKQIEMHFYFMAKFTKCFRQVQQVGHCCNETDWYLLYKANYTQSLNNSVWCMAHNKYFTFYTAYDMHFVTCNLKKSKTCALYIYITF